MKNIFYFFTALLFINVNMLNAQNFKNNYASNHTLYEIDKENGNIITDSPILLYDYLDNNKYVFIDFSATWCAPCWNYHETHAMRDAWNKYGPEGTDEIRILYIEADKGNYQSLAGKGKDDSGVSSKGDWLTGTPYPVIPANMAPNRKFIVDEFEAHSYPTLCMVCPNGTVIFKGSNNKPNAEGIYNMKNQCPDIDLENNALIFDFIEPRPYSKNLCKVTPKILLQNVGTKKIESIEFTIKVNEEKSIFSWEGEIESRNTQVIALPNEFSEKGSYKIEVTINKVNGVEDTDLISNSFTTPFDLDNEVSATTVEESFTYSPFPPRNWTLEGEELLIHDTRRGTIYFNSYNLMPGSESILTLPLMDLKDMEDPMLSFDISHQRYYEAGTTNYDNLKVILSSDCGNEYITIYEKNTSLATVPQGTEPGKTFEPSDASQWRTDRVNLKPYFEGKDLGKIIIKFIITGGDAGIIWFDNIKVASAPLSIGKNNADRNGISLYPNPVEDVLNIKSDIPVQSIEILNPEGRLLKKMEGIVEVLVPELPRGVYIVRIITEKGVYTQKFMKQ